MCAFSKEEVGGGGGGGGSCECVRETKKERENERIAYLATFGDAFGVQSVSLMWWSDWVKFVLLVLIWTNFYCDTDDIAEPAWFLRLPDKLISSCALWAVQLC